MQPDARRYLRPAVRLAASSFLELKNYFTLHFFNDEASTGVVAKVVVSTLRELADF